MAGLSISVTRNRVGEVTEKLRREARAQQVQTAQRVRDRARAVVPVRTGALRDSIQTNEPPALGTKPDGLRVIQVVAGMPYATFVEFGTRYMSARPYLRPALEGERSGYTSAFSSLLRSL